MSVAVQEQHNFVGNGSTSAIIQVGLGIGFHQLRWTTPNATANVKLEKSANGVDWSDLIANQAITTSDESVVTSDVANFVRITVSSFAGVGPINVWYGGWITYEVEGTGVAGRVAIWSASSSISSDASFLFNTTTKTLTVGANILTNNGAASTPILSLTGTTFSGGSATTTKPSLLIEPSGTTSTGWSTSGTLLGGNAASGFTGNLFDFQLNGTSKASLTSTGAIQASNFLAGTTTATSGIRSDTEGSNTTDGAFLFINNANAGFGGGAALVGIKTAGARSGNFIHLKLQDASGTVFGIYGAGQIGWSSDTFIQRNAAGVVAITTDGGATYGTLRAKNNGLGTETFGTNATNTLALFNGTVPSTSPADTVQLFSTDISAGNASLGIRTETAVAVDVVADSSHTLSVTINGTIYKIMLKTP